VTAPVVLSGRPGGTTARSVEVLSGLPAEFRLIGGLAVLCRVGVPHRATVDLDALARGLASFDDELRSVALSAPGGGQYLMEGRLELDVIDVGESDAQDLVDELLATGEALTDLELNAVAHTWAHDVATPLDLVVVSEADGTPLASASDRLVASPGGLVAMKAMTVPLRASSKPEKRASDLYDLGRLLTTTTTWADELELAPAQLRDQVRRRAHRWFVDPAGRDRTFRDTRRFDEVRLDLDDVADAVQDHWPDP
jgi:hypothetical protein